MSRSVQTPGRRVARRLAGLGLLLLPGGLLAQSAGRIEYTTYTLANGLDGGQL